jgi:hypothetical protein
MLGGTMVLPAGAQGASTFAAYSPKHCTTGSSCVPGRLETAVISTIFHRKDCPQFIFERAGGPCASTAQFEPIFPEEKHIRIPGRAGLCARRVPAGPD